MKLSDVTHTSYEDYFRQIREKETDPKLIEFLYWAEDQLDAFISNETDSLEDGYLSYDSQRIIHLGIDNIDFEYAIVDDSKIYVWNLDNTSPKAIETLIGYIQSAILDYYSGLKLYLNSLEYDKSTNKWIGTL